MAGVYDDEMWELMELLHTESSFGPGHGHGFVDCTHSVCAFMRQKIRERVEGLT